ncbi:hypothetical protein [Propionivibrio sp.]|uniref:hypothetical protein n=1 Tax=Propionivibrio sp. TaxID=2212460 RepID=UPI00261162A8|nr:hypothetical protein [Propionivibrio sp.]
MEDTTELQRITRLIVDAMHISTDRVTAAGAANVAALKLENFAQGIHFARCIAAFTTDDTLANDLAEIVGESPKFLLSKVLLANFAPEQCTGEHADLEKRIWTSIYAGRRERSRVQKTLGRRSLI